MLGQLGRLQDRPKLWISSRPEACPCISTTTRSRLFCLRPPRLSGRSRSPWRRSTPTGRKSAGHQVIKEASEDGTLAVLRNAGVQVLPDLCWCSISEPPFPTKTKAVITNSGKYAHYGPGLSGRPVRLASLGDCVEAVIEGRFSSLPSGWKEVFSAT